MNTFSRRDWIQYSSAMAVSTAASINAVRKPCSATFNTQLPYSFLVVGDLHYDRLDHHDFAWLDKNHPNDLSQIQNYSKLTSTTMPHVFDRLKREIRKLEASNAPAAFVIQVGDFVEGLCGSEELSVQQNQEAIAFINHSDLGVPFLFTKGNHDVTGDGAKEAFRSQFHPFIRAEAAKVDGSSLPVDANYRIQFGNDDFVFFDAYESDSLDWFEGEAAKLNGNRLFFIVHPPVVPYGARSSWHLYSDAKMSAKRTEFLNLLASHQAIVLGGHLHKYSMLERKVEEHRFMQLAVCSIVSAIDEQPRDELDGVDRYSADQVNLEPNHSPSTIDERRAIYDRERESIKQFQYANSAGFACITVRPDATEARIFSGCADYPFRTVRLRTA